MSYPHDVHGIAVWTLIIAVAYIVLAIITHFIHRRADDFTHWMRSIFDGVLFASSVVLLWGIYDHTILLLLTEITAFLIMGGLSGIAWGVFNLLSKD
jgi:uncharacterized membrane protein HdeD (DUF308 family)